MRNTPIYLFIISLLVGAVAHADTVGYCDDYFISVWNTRLDMSSRDTGVLEDIPALQLGSTGPLTYSGGVLSLTSAGNSPRVGFLQTTVSGSIPVGTRYGENHPIDSSFYRYLVVKMYSDQDATAQIRWFHDINNSATAIFPVTKGWHTYSVDLPNATLLATYGTNTDWGASAITGLELIPVNKSGVTVKIDWVQLTPNNCGSYPVTYSTADQTTRKKVVIDDDTSYLNGYTAASSTASGGSTSFAIGKHLMFPGSYQIYGIQSDDWATLERGNPWDMDASEVDQDVDLELPISNFSTYGYSNGAFTGTTVGPHTDANFYLKIPPNATIDTSIYRYVYFKINYTSIPGGGSLIGHVYLFDSADHAGRLDFIGSSGPQTLRLDASTITTGTVPGWTGIVKRVRFDPSETIGTSFALDFISFNQSGASVYPSPSNFSLPSMTQTALGSVTVSDLSVAFNQPDKEGGRDYAQTVLGNSWNMNSPSDFVYASNVTDPVIYPYGQLTDQEGNTVTGDLFFAQNAPGNGDPNYYSVLQNGLIDTNDFVNICFRAWNATESSGYNSVARIIWQDPRLADQGKDSSQNGDDIVMRRGIAKYCLDMRSSRESQTEPPVPNGSPNPWTSISANGRFVNFFRVDLNENEEEGYYSAFDYIHLRADHEADTQFAIAVNAPLSEAVSLYYNTSQSTSGGVFIATLSAGRSSNVYKWNTTSLPAATYYIYGVATSNGNTLSHLAEGRIKVSHSITQDSTPPILVCERPLSGDSFDSSLQFAGYALDDTRTAAVEAFYSNDGGTTYHYLSSITPDRFHLGARDAYPDYAESNNPGFLTTVDTSGLSNGAYTIKVIATDTAGNATSCTSTVTKSNGASPTPITYPSPSSFTAAVPTPSVTPTPLPTPTATPRPTSTPILKVAIDKKVKDQLDFIFTSTTLCSSGTVNGALTTTMLTSAPTALGAISATAKSIKLPALTNGKKGFKIYFQAVCDDGRKSAEFALDVRKLGTSRSKRAALANILLMAKKYYKKL